MKRLTLLLVCILIVLSGCKKEANATDRAIAARQRLLSAAGCSFDVDVAADYGDKVYTFSMNCRADESGAVTFTVTKPESISGISGSFTGEGGKLNFDGSVLAFSMMADGLLSPVSAPWVMLRALRGGYLTDCTRSGEGYRVNIDDSLSGQALRTEFLLDGSDIPTGAEIFWKGRRILSLKVLNFTFL